MDISLSKITLKPVVDILSRFETKVRSVVDMSFSQMTLRPGVDILSRTQITLRPVVDILSRSQITLRQVVDVLKTYTTISNLLIHDCDFNFLILPCQ